MAVRWDGSYPLSRNAIWWDAQRYDRFFLACLIVGQVQSFLARQRTDNHFCTCRHRAPLDASMLPMPASGLLWASASLKSESPLPCP